MADSLSKLFFPLTTIRLSGLFIAGDSLLDVSIKKTKTGYETTFLSDKKPLKLTLEKTDQEHFSRSLLQYYLHRKAQGTGLNLLARIGLHHKAPLVMDYVEQKYKFKFPAHKAGDSSEMQLFYSPVLKRMVVRAVRG